MKHGRVLGMAIERMARTDPLPESASEPAYPADAEPLVPLRPGAFAGWAARRPADSPTAATEPRRPSLLERPALPSRPPAV
jgi:hypothetical protein